MLKQSLRVLMASAVVLSLFCGAANARGSGATINVQEKLSLLGYDVGSIDGRMGRKTRDAIKSFQQDAHLKADGVAGPRTIRAMDEMLGQGGARPKAANHQLDIYEDVLTDRLAAGSVQLPSRFGQVSMVKQRAGRFEIKINGASLYTAPAGSALPRISRTFSIAGEDAYVFALNTPRNRQCGLSHFIFSVRADGSSTAPLPLGNCKEVMNGRIEDDRLVISFPPKNVPSWRLEESWIYSNGTVVQK